MVLLIVTVLCVVPFASQKLETDSIGKLIKEYSLAVNPNMNPDFNLTITEYDVDGLWDSLNIQIVNAVYRSLDGTWFNEGEFICFNGTVRPFACAFGGYGLMSGVVQNKTFYYTYSWGSGIHRSHVGCLFFYQNTLVIIETGGMMNFDLFVAKSISDSLYVYKGRYLSFNSWTANSTPPWRVLLENNSGLVVFDSTGKEVKPDFPLVSIRENTYQSAWRISNKSAVNESANSKNPTNNYVVNLRGQIVRKRMAPSMAIDVLKNRTYVSITH